MFLYCYIHFISHFVFYKEKQNINNMLSYNTCFAQKMQFIYNKNTSNNVIIKMPYILNTLIGWELLIFQIPKDYPSYMLSLAARNFLYLLLLITRWACLPSLIHISIITKIPRTSVCLLQWASSLSAAAVWIPDIYLGPFWSTRWGALGSEQMVGASEV